LTCRHIYQIPVYKELTLSNYFDFKNLVGKEVDLGLVEEWVNNSLVLIENGGAPFFLTKERSMDKTVNMDRITYTNRLVVGK